MSTKNGIKTQIKFAVVMYGGGSLAIYINGVAQELQKLAQATSLPASKLSGTALIYRKIALLLSGKEDVVESIAALQREIDTATDAATRQGLAAVMDTAWGADSSVDFVIDVLTGSSAGGINAIFLAKALVNGSPDMLQLQKLWLEQGDFAKLLNDRGSVTDNPLNSPVQPKSLLNGQRMYLELLKALDGLDAAARSEWAIDTPLNLFVTYTDFEGLPTKMQLADKDVLERVHKRVFEFGRDRSDRNDFGTEMNPFLAFAARCTSSFPFAFPPMRLADIDEVIEAAFPEHSDGTSDNAKWSRYFGDLSDDEGGNVDWGNRWLVDGGCLDNKPFGHAIDKLAQSTGEGVVERKLLYIEPNPESFREGRRRSDEPNALENVFAQASGLPSYETIREDLRRVLDRNRLIERVARVTAEAEEALARNPDWLKRDFDKNIDWSSADLADVARAKGPAFLPYYHLRVSSTTDDIARLVTKFFGIDDSSDYFKVVRSLVRGWREGKFRTYNDQHGERPTLNRFLYLYDVEYRARRLRFVLQKADHLLRCKAEIFAELSRYAESLGRDSEAQENAESVASDAMRSHSTVLPLESALHLSVPGRGAEAKRRFVENLSDERYIAAVLEVQRRLSEVYVRLRRDQEGLRGGLAKADADPRSSLASWAAEDEGYRLRQFQSKLRAVDEALIELEWGQQAAERGGSPADKRPPKGGIQGVLEFFKPGTGSGRDPKSLRAAAFERLLRNLRRRSQDGCAGPSRTEGRDLLEESFPDQHDARASLIDALDDAGRSLDSQILNPEDGFLSAAREGSRSALHIGKHAAADAGSDPPPPTREAVFVQNYLRNYYLLFDSYDQISFPLFFESSVGEAVQVDVIRVSSRDAKSLIDEESAHEDRRKLAGNYLFSFGAFLDPRWRLNDIMWGRLDGAERLITTLLPGEAFAAHRASLIDEANRTILSEMLLGNANASFQETVVDALTLASSESAERDAVDRLVRKLTTPMIRAGLTSALTNTLDPRGISASVKESYEVTRKLEPRPTLETISRSTEIIGKILQNIAESKAAAGDRLSWIARLGQLFWGLVIVAAPNGILNSVFKYWIQLLYLFEVVVIAGATLFSKTDLQQFGIICLIITLVIHLSVIALQEVMLGDRFWKKLFRFLMMGILAILTVTGALAAYSLFFSPGMWTKVSDFQKFVVHTDFDRWRTPVFVLPFAALLTFLALWREAQKMNLPVIGRTMIAGSALLVALGSLFDYLSGGNGDLLLALPFAEDAAAVHRVRAGLGDSIAGAETAIWLDSLAFVPLYFGLFVILSALLQRRRTRWAFGLGIAAMSCAAAAAGADLIENHYSLVAMASGDTVGIITSSARVKWVLVFATSGLLSAILWRGSITSPWNFPAGLLMLSAVAGAAATLVSPLPYLLPAMAVPLLVWGAIGIALQFKPARASFQKYF